MNCHTAFHQSLLLIIFLSKQYLHAINIRLKHLRRWRFGTHTFVPSETAAIFASFASPGPGAVWWSYFPKPQPPHPLDMNHHSGRYSPELLSVSLTFRANNKAFSYFRILHWRFLNTTKELPEISQAHPSKWTDSSRPDLSSSSSLDSTCIHLLMPRETIWNSSNLQI